MRIERDFLIIDNKASVVDCSKGLLLKNWSNIDIEPTSRYSIDDLRTSDVNKTAKHYEALNGDCAIYHVVNQKVDSSTFSNTHTRKMEDLTTNLFVIDIDDQALNINSDYYQESLDNAQSCVRYGLSLKLESAIINEIKEHSPTDFIIYRTVSSKGFHWICAFSESYLNLIGTKRTLSPGFITKYQFTDKEIERLDIDLLFMHQLKRADSQVKPTYIMHSAANSQSKIVGVVPPNIFIAKENLTAKHVISDLEFNRLMPNFSHSNIDEAIRTPNAFFKVLDYYGIQVDFISNNRDCRICCMFHDDNKPSLSIDINRNLYHCFGCGAKGNIYSFIRCLENLPSEHTSLIINSIIKKIFNL